MLDQKLFRNENDLKAIQVNLAKRGFELPVTEISSLEQQRKELQVETQSLQNQRNAESKKIGQAKAAGEDIEPLRKAVAQLGDQLATTNKKLNDVQAKLQDIYQGIPNLLHESVPEGKDEDDNTVMRHWGTPPQFDFNVKDHVDLGAGLLDFESATKLTGARFVVIRNQLAKLHRALAPSLNALISTIPPKTSSPPRNR